MSHRKRAVNPLIARRAFLSLTFIQATLHACIPACDFTFSEIQSYYSLFLQVSTFTSHLPTHEECTPLRFLFAFYSRSARFIRALFARLRVFQRKFSANHAKSAYFQRKSRIVSVNLTGNARPSMEKHGGRAPHIFSQHIESI